VNSFIKYIHESLSDHKAFVEHLLSIIDTKLQFTKHRTNGLISSYSSTPVLQKDRYSALPENFTLDMDNAPSANEKVFVLIEKYSKTTNLLLLLRSKLAAKNVNLIYDLLNNDRFLGYEGEELEQLLEKSLY
jgi:hypothetical protein